ncbi:hypothetical protein ASF61_16770 [Duganella sp. Leaf126]|uniref:phage tail length tape measure family protein n=1 Tax=Duganella sp. Leaf126 TaxID=1736266 RepID=UPI0006F43472|nr:phage tail length tape measure family protein [Duganella sp. Leaf126]KQQ31988.1 hypothetical protein ASF61_16770 [Duganella sp. Leaf126]
MSESRGVQIEAEVNTTGTRAGFNEIGQQADAMARTVTRASGEAERAVVNVGTGSGRSARSVAASQRSMIAEIQRTTAAMEAGSRTSAQYFEARARQLNVNPETLAPYLTQLRAVEGAQRNVGMSAAATAAAMRNVPAQFTDIVTSLQGGMPVLTVLTQQGGQLRDMFGGAGAAARALGGYMLSLVSPFTVAAAAAVALGVAYYQGSKEADAYSQAIASTGNAAGVTAGQLGDMAKAASQAAGTQGKNAEVLAQLVGTGKVAADQLVAASVTAVQSQKYLGIEVEKTVQAFAELGGDPLKASIKLGEQYGYLTLQTYKQVKALEDQGRKSDAAKVAQAAYADAMKEKSGQVEASLGTLQRTWGAVGSAAKSAWDRMLDIGREPTLADKIKAARQRLEDAQKGTVTAAPFSSTGMAPTLGFGTGQKDTKEQAQKDLDALLQQEDKEKRLAAIEAERNRLAEAGITWAKEGDQYLTRADQLQKQLNLSREQGLAAGESDVEIAKRALAIRASFGDVSNAGVEAQISAITRLGAVQEEAAKRARMLLEADEALGASQALDQRMERAELAAKRDEEALQREKARQDELIAVESRRTVSEDQRGEQQRKLADMRGQIAVIDEQILTRRAKLTVDLNQMDVDASRAAFESLDRLQAAREADVAALRGQLQAQKDENATIGMNSKQLQAYNTERVEEVANIELAKAATLDGIAGREAEAEAIRESVRLMRELNVERGIGASKKESVEQWKEAVKKYDDIFRQGFADMLNNGKSGWKSFTKSLTTTFKTSVADEIYKMFAKPFVVNMVGNMMGMTGAGVPGMASAMSMAGAGSSALDLVSMGQKIYQGFTTGFSTVGATLGGYVATLGNMFGSASVSAFGAGMGMTGAQAANAAAAYSAAGMAGTGSAISAGSFAGATLGEATGILGGVYGGRIISGGYGISGSGNSTVNAGTAIGAVVGSVVPVLGTALGALVGGLLGGVANRFFGYKSAQVESQGLKGTISSSGIDAQAYANILQKGGYLRSDKRRTENTSLDTETDNSLDTTIKTMIASVKGFGKALGIEANAIDGYTKVFDLKLTGDAAKDNELVVSLLDTVSTELAERLVPGLSRFAAQGEVLSATLQRVTADYVAVDTVLDAIGQTARVTGVAGIEARERLIAAAGGLQVLANGVSSFQQNYLTQAEQLAPVQKQVAAQLASMGQSSLKTTDQFKAAVLGIDVSTEAGAKLFAQMIALAPAFKQVADYADELAGAVRLTEAQIRDQASDLRQQLNEITMSQVQLLEIQRAAIADVNKSLFDQVQAAKRVASAKDVLASAYSNESSAMKTAIDASKSWVSTLKGMNDSLALGNLSILTPEQQYAEARRQFEQTLAAANSGDAAAQGRLSAAEQAFLTASQAVNASDAKYAADYARVIAANQDAAKWAAEQVDLQHASYDALEAQVKGLITINDSVLTVAQAIAQLQVAMGVSDAQGVKFTNAPAVVATAASAAPAIDYSRYSAASNAGSDALVAEVKALREEVKALRSDQAAQTSAVVKATAESNAKAAGTVVAGVEKSAKASAWASTVKKDAYDR